MTEEERNIAILRRYAEEAWGRGNFAVLDDVLADDYVGHSNFRTRDRRGLEDGIRAYRESHPDLTFSIEDQFAAGDRVATRLVVRSQGQLARGLNISRFVDRRLAEEWAVWTDFELEP